MTKYSKKTASGLFTMKLNWAASMIFFPYHLQESSVGPAAFDKEIKCKEKKLYPQTQSMYETELCKYLI